MPITRKSAPKSGEFVVYYRVSTDKQGRSRLGLEQQQQDVARIVRDAPVVAEFTEVETGKSSKKRPAIQAAVAEARKRKAILIIAKIDRLARNVHFVTGLMESKVKFVCADMPEANDLVIQVMAAFAEREGKVISERTRDAMQQIRDELAEKGFRISPYSKRRFEKLGNPRWEEALKKAWAARRKPRQAEDLRAIVRQYRTVGKSYRAIAATLNELGLKTPAGGSTWYAASVRAVILPANSSRT